MQPIRRILVRLGVPARYEVLLWVAGLFVSANTLVRLGLVLFEADTANFLPERLLPIIAIGLLYDVAALSALLVPFALGSLVFPNGAWGRKVNGFLASAHILALIFALLFVGVAEFFFWNEFSSRFNFIAVDYLIYTRETLGNVRESYPVMPLLATVVAATLAAFWLIRKPVWAAGIADGGRPSQRMRTSGALLLMPVGFFLLLGDGPREALPTTAARELAGDGYYDFVRAFRANDLDFFTFYQTMPEDAAEAELRAEFEEAQSAAAFTNTGSPIARKVVAEGEPKRLNVMLVTMESMGADFLKSFGGQKRLTPYLDRLAADGMQFTRIYATGTRTVRGLEALSLSIPPTPGQAVIKRANNKGFQTLGGIFKEQGYEPLFVYGGYSYFDNMQDFFGGNGYTVIDRTSLPASEISHETIWGVADEDLFRMVIGEMDRRTADGKRVFAHIMTTSNHRPYTYPSGRIDIPSGSGREGAVMYSDWAIGDFIRRAAKRPWFKDTMFVFIADHTSHARGRTDLPPENYHIPLIIYSPSHIAPQAVDTIASQIDVGPTILALLNMSYMSKFFGQDILTEGRWHQRALMSNYLTVGHLENNVLVELAPKRRVRVSEADTGRELPADDPRRAHWIYETVAHYQVATKILRLGAR
ncbi:MAG: sulfatase-like hydrolase/transferase [Bradyrhizobiaceae bacterium]|nr:sulfatase-like hydrolase/transferase [Bradyrhizobiaceae bacterium]